MSGLLILFGGIALFAGLVALFYACLYAAYLVGFEPWSASIG